MRNSKKMGTSKLIGVFAIQKSLNCLTAGIYLFHSKLVFTYPLQATGGA